MIYVFFKAQRISYRDERATGVGGKFEKCIGYTAKVIIVYAPKATINHCSTNRKKKKFQTKSSGAKYASFKVLYEKNRSILLTEKLY